MNAAIFRAGGDADGQDLTPGATGSGNRAVADPEDLSGLRVPDAHTLREPSHGGDPVGDAAVVFEDPALRTGWLRAPGPGVSAGSGRRDRPGAPRIRPGCDCAQRGAASSPPPQRAGDPPGAARAGGGDC